MEVQIIIERSRTIFLCREKNQALEYNNRDYTIREALDLALVEFNKPESKEVPLEKEDNIIYYR